MKTKSLIGAAVVLGALTVSAPLMAQSGGPGGPGRGPGGPMFGAARMCENREARTAGMLAYAEKRLNITESQRGAWDTFRQAAEASGAPVAQACSELAAAQPPRTLPERMARMERFHEATLQQMKTLRPAVETLYAQLTPEQRQTADQLMSRGGWRGRGHGHGGFGPGGHAPSEPGEHQRG
ncbi:Spy/CpxP family protein refolding chaperone [Arenibaculum pallidiluteum]|uniref:Spy/CpxP family protein refolding chaperone n=1 Tax=Arenibaculum pallidiluteum TaxID=2812559 RepID=UPI001A966380|nr:Spy/CpxP family protein refolding chaperone [Arenibaculum pallidiluteum]